MGEAIGMGIVIGAMGFLLIAGVLKLASWCYETSEKIGRLEGILKLEPEWEKAAEERCTTLEKAMIENKDEATKKHLELVKATFDSITVLSERVSTLEKYELLASGSEIEKEKEKNDS